jgi:pectate lyase
MPRQLSSILPFLAILVSTGTAIPVAAGGPLAFPGAEGFGAEAVGGRGGKVYIVTTLEDYYPGRGPREAITRNKTGEVIRPAMPAVEPETPIPGSLRAAIDAEGPRTIVFQVGGTIELKDTLVVQNPYITIAGQTAPGGGICLKDYGLNVSNTHDVVIRCLRCRPGDETRLAPDSLDVSRSQNVIIDRCSTSWSIDENLSVTGEGTNNVTVQWCIISESLHDSCHPKGPHGMGSLLRIDGDLTFHHNLFAHNNARNPRPGTYGDPRGIHLDFRNNVIYNWVGAGYSAADPANMNYIGNFLKTGPSTIPKNRQIAFSIGGETTRIYPEGNVLVDGDTTVTGGWEMIEDALPLHKLDKPLPVKNIETQFALVAFGAVLAKAGATAPMRDAVDRRVIEDVRDGTGRIINSQTEVGVWPRLAPGTPLPDTDRDGMPDAWEEAHYLNPKDPKDGPLDPDGDGYTNLEDYLNGLVE